MKKTMASLMAVMMLVSMSTAVFADNPDLGNCVQNTQEKSFSRPFSGDVSGEDWTKVGWDINVYGDKRLEIELDESEGQTVMFRIVQDGPSVEVTLSEGQSEVVTLNGSGFTIYAQIEGSIKDTASISGYFNLAKG